MSSSVTNGPPRPRSYIPTLFSPLSSTLTVLSVQSPLTVRRAIFDFLRTSVPACPAPLPSPLPLAAVVRHAAADSLTPCSPVLFSLLRSAQPAMTHSAVFAFPSTSRHISALPQELLEEILIIASALGFPTTASVFAQTCRASHKLVYQPFHSHLWREMFLEVFDDPRPSQAINSFGCAQPSRSRSASPSGKGKGPALPKDEYPWKTEYQSRIWTAIYIRRRTTQPIPPDLPTTSADLQKVAETLLSVITTAEPLPSTSF
ncbi:hypothetical protein EVG20_g11551, partial [Dentipellis fragilis]